MTEIDLVRPRQPLDRRRIVAAAMRFIDTEGLERLTMRRLGARLQVEAMALYRYVPSRDQLLDAVVDALMDDLYEATVAGERATSWQAYLQNLATLVRALAITHPRAFPLITSRPPEAPWLRPPLRSLRWVEDFLGELEQFGFTPRNAVHVYRSFATVLLGHLLIETSSLAEVASAQAPAEQHSSAPVGGPDTPLDASRAGFGVNPEDYPRIAANAELLAEDRFVGEFEESLEDLINRVALRVSSPD